MIILVAEDDTIAALDIAEALVLGGHRVLGPAYTVGAALRLAKQTRPDLALIDINLHKDDDGTQLARLLTRDWQVPCLFVSGELVRAREAREAALGCLQKPFSREALIACVALAQRIGDGDMPAQLPAGLELF